MLDTGLSKAKKRWAHGPCDLASAWRYCHLLGLKELVGEEGKDAADQDDGVEADACRGAVCGGRRCAGGSVRFGLWVVGLKREIHMSVGTFELS